MQENNLKFVKVAYSATCKHEGKNAQCILYPLSQFNKAIFKSPLKVLHVRLHFLINHFGKLVTRALDKWTNFRRHIYFSAYRPF